MKLSFGERETLTKKEIIEASKYIIEKSNLYKKIKIFEIIKR